MQLCNGIGNNEEGDHKTLSIVWGESLPVCGKQVSLIQSTTAEMVQLCNTLTTMYTITENFMQKKSIIYIHCNRYYIIYLFMYLFIYSINAKISKVVPYTEAFNIKMQYCMHSVKHTTKKIIL